MAAGRGRFTRTISDSNSPAWSPPSPFKAKSTAACADTVGQWDCKIETQLFLNQPRDLNMLEDGAFRRSFAANFEVDTLQVSQLYLARAARRLAVDGRTLRDPLRTILLSDVLQQLFRLALHPL